MNPVLGMVLKCKPEIEMQNRYKFLYSLWERYSRPTRRMRETVSNSILSLKGDLSTSVFIKIAWVLVTYNYK